LPSTPNGKKGPRRGQGTEGKTPQSILEQTGGIAARKKPQRFGGAGVNSDTDLNVEMATAKGKNKPVEATDVVKDAAVTPKVQRT